jgi:hypothetical protein
LVNGNLKKSQSNYIFKPQEYSQRPFSDAFLI